MKSPAIRGGICVFAVGHCWPPIARQCDGTVVSNGPAALFGPGNRRSIAAIDLARVAAEVPETVMVIGITRRSGPLETESLAQLICPRQVPSKDWATADGAASAQAANASPTIIDAPFVTFFPSLDRKPLLDDLVGESEQRRRHHNVENMSGAGGNVGTGRAALAAPDGYTVLVVDGIAYVANPSLYKSSV